MSVEKHMRKHMLIERKDAQEMNFSQTEIAYQYSELEYHLDQADLSIREANYHIREAHRIGSEISKAGGCFVGVQ